MHEGTQILRTEYLYPTEHTLSQKLVLVSPYNYGELGQVVTHKRGDLSLNYVAVSQFSTHLRTWVSAKYGDTHSLTHL